MNPLIALQASQPLRDRNAIISDGGNALFNALQTNIQSQANNRVMDMNQQRLNMAQEQHAMNQQQGQFNLDAMRGSQLYNGLKSIRSIEDEAQRKAAYDMMAPALREMGIPEEHIEGGWQTEELDTALAALSRFAPIDPNSSAIAPSSVREYQYFNSLTDEEKEQYLTMKRANPSYKMGDVHMRGNQLSPTAQAVTESGAASQAEVQNQITEQQAEKEAAKEAATTAIKKSEEAFDRIAPIRQNIANYDEAIRLIDEGAETGVIAARLPSVKQASIELDNLQGKLGLDVIGNTTFGALSEAELRFALSTALPKNLEGPALKDWLQRKKAAQQKLLAYTERAATYLGTPGNTVSGWVKLQRQEALDRVPPQALDYLRQNPHLKDSFMDKYGVLPDGI